MDSFQQKWSLTEKCKSEIRKIYFQMVREKKTLLTAVFSIQVNIKYKDHFNQIYCFKMSAADGCFDDTGMTIIYFSHISHGSHVAFYTQLNVTLTANQQDQIFLNPFNRV